MPYEMNVVENVELMEVLSGDFYDAPRYDPDRCQQQLKVEMAQLIKQELEHILSMEAEEQVRASLYERNVWGRRDRRNGYRKRKLITSMGEMELRVPRARHLGLTFSCFERYAQRWREVDGLLLEAYMGGMSCRKAAERIGLALGFTCSGSTVAGLSRHLEESLKIFRSTPVGDDYKALILDGCFVRIKQKKGSKRGQPVMYVVYSFTISFSNASRHFNNRLSSRMMD